MYQMGKKNNSHSTTQKHSIRAVLQMSGVKCFVVHKTQLQDFNITVLQKGVKKNKKEEEQKSCGIRKQGEQSMHRIATQ